MNTHEGPQSDDSYFVDMTRRPGDEAFVDRTTPPVVDVMSLFFALQRDFARPEGGMAIPDLDIQPYVPEQP